MSRRKDPWSRFAELLVEQLQLSGKLDWSADAPVLKLRPAPVKPRKPRVPAPKAAADKRSSHEVRIYHAWVIYPHVVCTPVPDLELLARIGPAADAGTPRHAGDLVRIASQRHFYKLTRLGGRPLQVPWGCEVRYGPWYATVVCTQACSSNAPDHWELTSPVLDMRVEWWGDPDARPEVANLSVVWNPNEPATVVTDCCPGYRYCPSTGGCLADKVACQPIVPL